MWVIATTLLVYLAAAAAVFGTQFAAVIALMAAAIGFSVYQTLLFLNDSIAARRPFSISSL